MKVRNQKGFHGEFTLNLKGQIDILEEGGMQQNTFQIVRIDSRRHRKRQACWLRQRGNAGEHWGRQDWQTAEVQRALHAR